MLNAQVYSLSSSSLVGSASYQALEQPKRGGASGDADKEVAFGQPEIGDERGHAADRALPEARLGQRAGGHQQHARHHAGDDGIGDARDPGKRFALGLYSGRDRHAGPAPQVGGGSANPEQQPRIGHVFLKMKYASVPPARPPSGTLHCGVARYASGPASAPQASPSAAMRSRTAPVRISR